MLNEIRMLALATSAISLVGCGAYFLETEPLKSAHLEGALPYGVYLTEDSFLRLVDGPDTFETFCSDEDGDTLQGDLYTIPTETGVILLGANITEVNNDVRDNLIGEYIYFIVRDGDTLAMFDPVNEALKDDGQIPFVWVCSPDDPTPENAAYHVQQDGYCLKDDAKLDDIRAWFDNAELGEQTSTLRFKPDAGDEYECASEPLNNIIGSGPGVE